MQQLFKRFLWIIGLVLGLQSAWGFSPAGPLANAAGLPSGYGDRWQLALIGYGLPGDLNTPKNIGEDYRRNTPVMYYVYDLTFSDFFGTNGETAVDGAFDVLNSLTNVDNYSIQLSEFSLETRQLNYQAQALGLFDLKSWTLGLMMEQLGLADPIRYDWTLHDRWHVGNIPCPIGQEYLVVQRNLDTFASAMNLLQYSPYVNDVLYSYQILELCSPPAPPDALAVPYSVDPLADIYSPLASSIGGIVYVTDPITGGLILETVPGINMYGTLYSGLTRDDMAGLRYLFSTNNVHFEDPSPGSLIQSTNTSFQTSLYTSNLTALVMASRTNDPATLVALFPGLEIGGSSNWLTVASNPIVTITFVVDPGSPAGTLPHAVVTTNGWISFFETNYLTAFANVIFTTNFFPNSFHTNTPAQLVTVTVAVPYGSPVGTLPTTKVSTNYITLTNVPSGDYYLIPPGTCGPEFIYPTPSFDTFTTTTNVVVTGTNFQGFFYSQSVVTHFTNHAFAVYACTLVTNTPDFYQGIQRIQYIRVPDTNFDSYNGVFYHPITNTYTMVVKTNGNQYVTRTFQRIVRNPDIRFVAADMATGPSDPLHGVATAARNLNFNPAHILNNLAGPGTITPPTVITFEKVGPVFFNATGDVLNGTPYFTETPGGDVNDFYYGVYFVWASYDGSTNDPIVFPNGTSLANLQSQVLFQVSPTSLPDGVLNTAYDSADATFSATGGQAPYSWSLATNSPALPQGLNLSTAGVVSGTPTGTNGLYDFTIQLTDHAARTLQLNYSINITP